MNRRDWHDWVWLISCALIGSIFVSYAWFKMKILIDIWKAVCK